MNQGSVRVHASLSDADRQVRPYKVRRETLARWSGANFFAAQALFVINAVCGVNFLPFLTAYLSRDDDDG